MSVIWVVEQGNTLRLSTCSGLGIGPIGRQAHCKRLQYQKDSRCQLHNISGLPRLCILTLCPNFEDLSILVIKHSRCFMIMVITNTDGS